MPWILVQGPLVALDRLGKVTARMEAARVVEGFLEGHAGAIAPARGARSNGHPFALQRG